MNLLVISKRPYTTGKRGMHIPKLMLILLQDLQSLRRNRSHRAPAHLNSKVLVVGISTTPRNLQKSSVQGTFQSRDEIISPQHYELQHC